MEVYGLILKESQQKGIHVHFSDCEEHMNDVD